MHPICYFRTDNIQVMGPFPAPSYLRRYLEVADRINTAKHAELDELEIIFYRRKFTGRRQTIQARRNGLRETIYSQCWIAQKRGFDDARRAAFIGPLTVSQQNGHPF